jgi:hypothetical protein
MSEEIFSLFYYVPALNIFLICPTASLGSRYCIGLRGKGGSESKIRRPEFLSSQIGNPNCDRAVLAREFTHRGLRSVSRWRSFQDCLKVPTPTAGLEPTTPMRAQHRTATCYRYLIVRDGVFGTFIYLYVIYRSTTTLSGAQTMCYSSGLQTYLITNP